MRYVGPLNSESTRLFLKSFPYYMRGVLEKLFLRFVNTHFCLVCLYLEVGSLPVISPVNINYMIGEEISY